MSAMMPTTAIKPELQKADLNQSPEFVHLLLLLDEGTRRHSLRVQKIVGDLARMLDFSKADQDMIRSAALFHDIGKVALDQRLLTETVALSAHQIHQVRLHPEIGHAIWTAIGGNSSVGEAILSHHEHFDGGGYPYGQSGVSIPLWARMIAIADALDAMVSLRHYSKPVLLDDALRVIINESGSQFDPNLVHAFCDLFARHQRKVFPVSAFAIC